MKKSRRHGCSRRRQSLLSRGGLYFKLRSVLVFALCFTMVFGSVSGNCIVKAETTAEESGLGAISLDGGGAKLNRSP